MIINQSNLQDLFRNYNAAFNTGFRDAKPVWNQIATSVPSSTKENHYGWLGQWPKLREWVGDRHVKSIQAHDYTVKNRKFESTVGVPRDDIEDDSYGVYAPMMQEQGYAAATHPDEEIFALLAAGTATACYDGQYFFDTDHPVAGASVANVDSGGASNYWYLVDASRALKPLIWQKRRDYAFRSLQRLDDEHVFMKDEFVFGVDARVNAGFGFWQQAFASNQTLNDANFDAAMQAMLAFKSDEGRPLGIRPTLLVCGPSNRAAALAAVKVARQANGADNKNYNVVDVLITPYLP